MSLHNQIQPKVITMGSGEGSVHMLLRISGDKASTMAGIQEVWKRSSPESTLDYEYLEDLLFAEYETEMLISNVFIFFAWHLNA